MLFSVAFQKLAFATVHSFHYDELKEASKNWSKNYEIGEGSFGTVYKVTLPKTGTTFAVKRMKTVSTGTSINFI
jgi:hypothetical protein